MFPTNDKLRIDLSSAVIPYLALAEDRDMQRKIALKLVEICQACTDKELQVQKHLTLAHLFLFTGQYENAVADTMFMKNDEAKYGIDISNGVMLKAGVPNTIDKIDLSLERLSSQLIYELRNKISYLQKRMT